MNVIVKTVGLFSASTLLIRFWVPVTVTSPGIRGDIDREHEESLCVTLTRSMVLLSGIRYVVF